jgi:hypothetical protein
MASEVLQDERDRQLRAASKTQMHFRRSAGRRLICKSFNYERKRVCCLHSGCIYLFLGRRIFKTLGLSRRYRI